MDQAIDIQILKEVSKGKFQAVIGHPPWLSAGVGACDEF